MQKFEKRMIGDEAKYMCDKCDYTGSSNRSVKMHWGKKHRKEALYSGCWEAPKIALLGSY